VFGVCDEATIGEPAETYERVRHAQPFVATAMGQLQRLRNKLDFTNSTTAKFHVEATLFLNLPIDLLLRATNARERSANRDIWSKNRRRH